MIVFYQRPVVRADFKVSIAVGNDVRPMTAAKRARACAERTIFRLLRKPKSNMNIAAMATA